MKNKKNKKDDNFFNKFKSPIPPHLTPEERKIWEKEIDRERKEHERRKQDGLYGSTRKRGRPKKPSGQEFSFIS